MRGGGGGEEGGGGGGPDTDCAKGGNNSRTLLLARRLPAPFAVACAFSVKRGDQLGFLAWRLGPALTDAFCSMAQASSTAAAAGRSCPGPPYPSCRRITRIDAEQQVPRSGPLSSRIRRTPPTRWYFQTHPKCRAGVLVEANLAALRLAGHFPGLGTLQTTDDLSCRQPRAARLSHEPAALGVGQLADARGVAPPPLDVRLWPSSASQATESWLNGQSVGLFESIFGFFTVRRRCANRCACR